MTVRETMAFIPKIPMCLVYNNMTYGIDPQDAFEMAAFGDFDVAAVNPGHPDENGNPTLELWIACKPIKNGVPV